MNLPKNIKTNQNLKLSQATNSEPPRTVVAQWHWKRHVWAAYQLPNGVKVMSERQVALIVGKSKTDVRIFAEQKQLESIIVQIPNGKIIKGYTLPAVAVYLRQLFEQGYLLEHRLSLSRSEWKQLIEALSNPERGKAVTPNPCFFSGNYRLAKAQTIQIKLENHIYLQVLVVAPGEYRIGYDEGMRCIHSNCEWLIDNSPKRAKTLSKMKLSKEIVECRVNTPEGVKQVYTLTCEDWLSVWEYFANRGNTRATAILKACAQESIPLRVAKALSQGQ
ncbi:hypothetical protein NIES37_39650 [Tolypothrix tenuis PCC 7101]|uniref:Uncharacterized protein n=1 Tax=Tolypothrix tenuis PCC 7101 TaxID=231146 RepID=A0A1Z4N2L6_9CYAN|nr:hypothetical protein NIES37_39650 [Tolypothrix tenuis PCC 7101]BAZ76096.1 hypothetical protein NIES50_46940 [Aulosira laxa NIES-50]